MVNKTLTPRPRLKHALTATAFAWIQARTAWRAYFHGLAEERRAQLRKRA